MCRLCTVLSSLRCLWELQNPQLSMPEQTLQLPSLPGPSGKLFPDFQVIRLRSKTRTHVWKMRCEETVLCVCRKEILLKRFESLQTCAVKLCEDLFQSVTQVTILQCGHTIHQDIWDCPALQCGRFDEISETHMT